MGIWMAAVESSAEGLAAEALEVCRVVVEAPRDRIFPAAGKLQWVGTLLGTADKLFQDGRYDPALPASLEALAAAAVFLDGAEHKVLRDKGLGVAKCAVDYFQSRDEPDSAAQAMIALARFQLVRNRPDQAIQTAGSAREALQRVGHRKGEATCLCIVVEAHVRKATLVASGKTVRKSHQLKMTPSEIEADLRKMSGVHLQDALGPVQEALDLFAKDKRSKADLMYTVADIRLSLNQLDDAKEYAMMARDFFHDVQDPKCEQMALLLELDAHVAGRDGAEALDVGKEIVKLFKKSKDLRGELEGMFTMMTVYGMMRQQEDMMSMASQLRALCRDSRDVKMEGLVVDAVMKYHMEQESWSEATASARDAIELYRKGSDRQGEAMAVHSCACLELDRFFQEVDSNIEYFKKMGCMQQYWKEINKAKYDECIEMLTRSVELFKQVGDQTGLSMAEETLRSTERKLVMLNDPDETRQIRRNGRVVETVRTWNPNPVREPEVIAAAG